MMQDISAKFIIGQENEWYNECILTCELGRFVGRDSLARLFLEASEMEAAVIDLKHLEKSFGKKQVLLDVSFQVQPGEIVGLIGPSGSGKSTIIKVMLGMEVSDAGEATVFDLQMPQRALLANIGYMAQSDALYEQLTAKENLIFFGQMKGLKKQELNAEVTRVAEVVKLTNDLNNKVEGFSGGMKRRLSLALALLGDPALLVLDEPTVGIDPALRRQVWAELKRLKELDRAILVTTHVMDEAELTDRVALLLGGRLIANDQPAALKEQYQVSSIEDVFLKAEGE
jgi:ABC-2 type transport system ATP-binding protein